MNLEELRRLRDKAQRDMQLRTEHQRFRIKVSMGTSGLAKGAREVMDAMIAEIEARQLNDVEVVVTGSSGVEELEPFVTVEEKDKEAVLYGRVDPTAARQIICDHVIEGRRVTSHVVSRHKREEVS